MSTSSCTQKFTVTSKVIFSRGMPYTSWKIKKSKGARLFTMAWVM